MFPPGMPAPRRGAPPRGAGKRSAPPHPAKRALCPALRKPKPVGRSGAKLISIHWNSEVNYKEGSNFVWYIFASLTNQLITHFFAPPRPVNFSLAPPHHVDCPTRWSIWYWYLNFYVDHLVCGTTEATNGCFRPIFAKYISCGYDEGRLFFGSYRSLFWALGGCFLGPWTVSKKLRGVSRKRGGIHVFVRGVIWHQAEGYYCYIISQILSFLTHVTALAVGSITSLYSKICAICWYHFFYEF